MKFSQTPIVAAGLLTAWLATAHAETNTAAGGKPSDKIAELFGDSVVAKGTDLTIKRSQLDAAAMGVKASAVASGKQLTPEQSSMLERQVLDKLIQIDLLNHKATDGDKAKGKEEAVKQFDRIIKRAKNEEALASQLKSVGLTVEELKARIAEEAIAEAVVVRELNADATDEEAKKYYADFPARFEQPEMVRASHILLMTSDPSTGSPLPEDKKAAKQKLAADLLKRARAGEDFAKLATEYSEDPGSRESGGEYKFPRGQMVAEFETAAFALKPNEVSEIVTTRFGFHIIKLSEKIPATKIELAKVNDEVKDALKRQKLEKALPNYIETLQKNAKVEILDEKLKKAGEMLEQQRADELSMQKAIGNKPEEKKADPKK